MDAGWKVCNLPVEPRKRQLALYQAVQSLGGRRVAEFALPLPMAFSGKFSADGKYFAYSPVGGASPFNYTTYTAWRNYRGGLASSVWIADMATLDVVKVPREQSNDFNPMWIDSQVYFLSDRNGPVSLFRFDPATKSVTDLVKNDGVDIRSASAGPGGIVDDRFWRTFSL